MRKLLGKLAVMMLVLALVAARCGDDDDDDTTATTEDTTDTTEETTDTTEDTTATTEDTTGGTSDEQPPEKEPSWACGDDKPDPSDDVLEAGLEAQFDCVLTALYPARVNPDACLTGVSNGQPIDLTEPHHPEDGLYDGPMYRPGLLIGPPDLDVGDLPDAFDGIQIGRVDLSAATGPTVNGETKVLSEDALDRINSEISVWSIVSADDELLLDPANIAMIDPALGLSPVHVLVPAGGHMYAPEGAASQGTTNPAPELGSDYDGSVAVIDTSFDAVPDGMVESVVGHGAFILGLIDGIIPGATVDTVDMGTADRSLKVALDGSLKDLGVALDANGQMPFDADVLKLALTMAAIGESHYDAVNMSFGTYICNGDGSEGDVAPVGLGAALRLDADAPPAQVFAAAGNDTVDTPWWPAAFGPSEDWIHSVGAVDDQQAWAWFSNFGGWVEQCELGADVSTIPNDRKGNAQPYTWNGTSFASPIAMAKFLAGENAEDCPKGP